MQTQNQHLLQQVTERDDYNIKVCSVIYTLITKLLRFSFFINFYLGCLGYFWPGFVVGVILQLVSESVKTKQMQSFLLSEKQALAKQLQQVNIALESLKLRIAQSEEQVSFLCTLQTTLPLVFLFHFQPEFTLQMKAFLAEALKYTQEDRHVAVGLETAKLELADAEKDLKWLKSTLASSEKEYEQIQRRKEEVQMELENERCFSLHI